MGIFGIVELKDEISRRDLAITVLRLFIPLSPQLNIGHESKIDSKC